MTAESVLLRGGGSVGGSERERRGETDGGVVDARADEVEERAETRRRKLCKVGKRFWTRVRVIMRRRESRWEWERGKKMRKED